MAIHQVSACLVAGFAGGGQGGGGPTPPKSPSRPKPCEVQSAMEIQKRFYSQYGGAFEATIKRIFGKDAALVAGQNIANAPRLDLSMSRQQLTAAKGIKDEVEGANRPDFGRYPAVAAVAHKGTIFISSDLVKTCDMPEICGTYAHELANLLDAQINGMRNLEKNYGDRNDPWDPDTGWNVEKHMFPQHKR